MTTDSAFVFSEEHLEFEQMVMKLTRREFADGYLERGRSDAMCWPELKALGRYGLLGLALPEEVGGQGADVISRGLACEQVSYADFNVGYLVFSAELVGSLVDGLAPEVGHPLLREVCAGERLIALALTEPRGGSDASKTAVRARAVDGGYVLSGEKTSVTLGMHASHAITVASVDPSLGSHGTRRFLVPLEDPTISRQSISDPGFRPLSRAGITFDEAFVPAEYEVRSERSGVSAQLSDFDLTRTLLGLMAIGAARRAMDTTVAWVRQREAFDKPIAAFQGVSFTLAERDTELEAARWLCYRTLRLRAAGLRHTREAAMCKWWAPKIAVQAINDCIILHGHVGWSLEMPLQQLLLDVSGLQIGDGTPQIQKLVIARQLIGREYTG